VALRIIPCLVAMLVAIDMFCGNGGLDILTHFPRPALTWIGFSAGVSALDPDSLIARTAGTIFGSTETTFYVIAVYFGSGAVRRTRHAIAAGLTADLTGVIVSVGSAG
jgi:spore maturation protein B